MHIPDGFLDTKTVAATALLAAAGVSMAVVRARRTVPPSKVPLLGLSAAFLFAAQMVNFPVAAGTSGHLIGSVLAAVMLGPSGAVIALSAVLIIQALLFGDGGLLALGANILNMAVVSPLVGFALYKLAGRLMPGARGRLAAAGFAAWCSVVAAAGVCAGELAWSGAVPWGVGLAAMTGIHALIGAGEAAITMLVIASVGRVRPDLVGSPSAVPPSRVSILVYAALVTCVVALFVAPFASTWPDGLEHVASTLGFSSRALPNPVMPSPLAGYRLPGIDSPGLAAGLAGGVGAVVVLLLSFVLAMVLVPRAQDNK
jgi:cobalt/nickel transport system permease protein